MRTCNAGSSVQVPCSRLPRADAFLFALFPPSDARLSQEEESSEWPVDAVLGRAWYASTLWFGSSSRGFNSIFLPWTLTNCGSFADILHGDINYFTENTSLGPQVSRLRGHFTLEGSTYEAVMSKKGLPKLVINRKSGIPYVINETEPWHEST